MVYRATHCVHTRRGRCCPESYLLHWNSIQSSSKRPVQQHKFTTHIWILILQYNHRLKNKWVCFGMVFRILECGNEETRQIKESLKSMPALLEWQRWEIQFVTEPVPFGNMFRKRVDHCVDVFDWSPVVMYLGSPGGLGRIKPLWCQRWPRVCRSCFGWWHTALRSKSGFCFVTLHKRKEELDYVCSYCNLMSL